jgi:hypothetical protein
MAITQDGLNKDQDEFNAAFAEDMPMTQEPSEDEAFGLDVEAVAAEDGEPMAEGEPESVALVMADTDDMEKVVQDEQAQDSAEGMADAGNMGDADKETQRLKSWEGRLKAMQAKLDAAGAKGEEQGEAVAEAIESASDSAETPADEEKIEQIAEQVESGEMSAEQAMKQLASDFGDDFVKMIEAIAVSKAREAGASAASEKFGEVTKTVDDIINDIVDTKAKAHFEMIADKHPDFNEIGASPEFTTWMDALPEADKADAQRVAASGSAKEIVKMLDTFKASSQKPESPMAEQDDAMDAAEGVRSTGMRLPQQPGAAEDDYLGAWDKY